MEPNASKSVTQMLLRCSSGDGQAMEELMPVVYDELRKLAKSYLRRENSGHTLQATALVNEAYLKLVDQRVAGWQNRAHFFGVSARLMRRILVDHARNKKAAKRGGTQARISFDEALHWSEDDGPDLVALDRALTHLAQIDERQCKIVELRYFAGLSIEETAEAIGSSPATVKRDWAMARAFLAQSLSGEGAPEEGTSQE